MDNQEKIKQIKEKYGNPYQETSFTKPRAIKSVLEDVQQGKTVSVAGRIITKREHGKSSFAHISDASGKIQLYLRLDKLQQGYSLFKDTDIGDIVGVSGELFKTRTGELTILVDQIKLLSKSLRTLPEKWHGLKDREVRYRQRYLDLISNQNSRKVFILRSKIIAQIRHFLNHRGYIEVETPMLQPIPGGASGSPFVTHHNSLDIDVYLRIAPELYLKRLLVGGLDRVYEINKSFRNEGVSVRHSPEFTMLEAYCAYCDYQYMMQLCEDLIVGLIKQFRGDNLVFKYQDKEIDFTPPWPRVSFAELFYKEFGVKAQDPQETVCEKVCKILDMPVKQLTRTQILNITEDLIEKYYPAQRPAFVVDFFSWTSPLAKKSKDNPYILERFELFIGGMELANSYSELNNPLEQRERFKEQIKQQDQEVREKIDEDFLISLEYAMPPAAGLGIGIDRLIMILLNQPSIRDVILFPLLKNIKDED